MQNAGRAVVIGANSETPESSYMRIDNLCAQSVCGGECSDSCVCLVNT